MSERAPSPSRRNFLANSAAALGGACAMAGGVGLYAESARARPAQAIRPPGALEEGAFLGACVRCGLCVRDCPWDTLKLGVLGSGVVAGTPYFEARQVPCEMCEDIPCAKACPTGALDHGLTDITEARMGLAVLIDQEHCLNFLGLRCDVCYRVCPVIDKAITLEFFRNPREEGGPSGKADSGSELAPGQITTRHALLLPTVHSDACTGCGKCEKSCVLPEPAIKVLPRKLAQGAPAEHYRKGWEEKEKAGGSLIGEQIKLPVRGLDDVSAPGAQP